MNDRQNSAVNSFNKMPYPPTEGKDVGLVRLLALLALAMGLTTGVYLIRQYLRQPLASLNATEQSAAIATTEFLGKVQSAMNFKVASLSGAIVRDISIQVGDRVATHQPLMILENLDAKHEYDQAQQQQEVSQQQIVQLQTQISYLTQMASLNRQMDSANGQFAKAQLQVQQVPLYQRQDSVRRAQAVYDLARVQYDRMNVLYQEGAMAQAEVDQAKADLQIAQADLSSARKAANASQILGQEQQEQLTVQQQVNTVQQQQKILELQGQLRIVEIQYEQATRKLQQIQQQAMPSNQGLSQGFQVIVRATKDGVVEKIPASTGDQIYVGTPLVEMSQIDRLNVEIPVSVRLINSLYRGQSATVQVGAEKGALKFQATVVSISPIPSDDLSHLVKVQFKNPNRLLLIGQPAKVHFAKE
ncbi:MAG: HlyD family efflux transporter periplasmic adaptor subunit [Leptolyngbyaceae cyanobacterium CSU_1_4]|nr:HlyD family efflux transporter periplasmic adaptor subunit [Leptolyngbyaceae cyanobacterium CSU_1_4]